MSVCPRGRLSRNHGGTAVPMGSLARSVCVSPLFLSDLRRAVLNPTDLYSLPFVNKSGH